MPGLSGLGGLQGLSGLCRSKLSLLGSFGGSESRLLGSEKGPTRPRL